MKTLRTTSISLAGFAVLLVFVLSGCTKDENDLVAPAQPNGIAKGLGITIVSDGTANGATDPNTRDIDDGDTISDDGDDVGDGERNKKKKPN